jgi:hypothetical protein
MRVDDGGAQVFGLGEGDDDVGEGTVLAMLGELDILLTQDGLGDLCSLNEVDAT